MRYDSSNEKSETRPFDEICDCLLHYEKMISTVSLLKTEFYRIKTIFFYSILLPYYCVSQWLLVKSTLRENACIVQDNHSQILLCIRKTLYVLKSYTL